MSPSQTIMAGFALMILVGAALLTLPIASKSGESVGFLNALFTATSANCVTGLIVVNTMEHWTIFGKLVIITLIQLGGLGFITVMTMGLLLAKRQISLRSRQAIQASYNQEGIGGMVRLIRGVLLVTLTFEAVGAVLLTVSFMIDGAMPFGQALYQGLFHAVSAFCNAGFDNLSTSSLVPYQSSVLINFIIMGLIVAGGIGFPVWREMWRLVKNPQKRSLHFRIVHLSLHAKITFVMTGILIFGGALLFLLLEWGNERTMGEMPVWNKAVASLFQSVTLRTAGFNSVPQDGLTEASKFISSIWMVIGGSPASAAGGIKTVTLGVLIFSTLSGLKGRSNFGAFKRSLPLDILQKALTVSAMILTIVLVATTVLWFTELNSPFPHTYVDLLFEVSSAAGTVGVTAGITPYLTAAGKIVLILCMFVGRIGPITAIVALNARNQSRAEGLEFADERVIIG